MIKKIIGLSLISAGFLFAGDVSVSTGIVNTQISGEKVQHGFGVGLQAEETLYKFKGID